MSLVVAIIVHPYFLENNIFIDPNIFIEHIMAVLRSNRELDTLPKAIGIGIGIAIGID